MTMMYLVLAFCVALFVIATAFKWMRGRTVTSGGYESTPREIAKQSWDIIWDIIQKVSGLLAILTVVLKYGFGIEI